MRAITIDAPGGPEVLQLGEAPDLSPGPGELLVDVYATAVNRADTLQRRGLYPPPPGASPLLGLEMAGRIAAAGPEVAGWPIGERVCALLAGGGYAEQVVIPAEMALRIPDNLSFREAAAVPEVWMTAYDNLFNWGHLRPGERALIHGGGSGIGTAAIQLVRHAGAEALVTAGSQAKLDQCVELGARAGINYKSGDWAARLQELTGGQGVNVILDIIGGPYLEANLASLATEGRLVIIGLMGGTTTQINLGALMSKRLTVTGTTLRARPLPAKIALTEQLRVQVLPGLADGSLRPIIHQVFPLAEAAAAHRLMEASDHFGKIVLEVREE